MPLINWSSGLRMKNFRYLHGQCGVILGNMWRRKIHPFVDGLWGAVIKYIGCSSFRFFKSIWNYIIFPVVFRQPFQLTNLTKLIQLLIWLAYVHKKSTVSRTELYGHHTICQASVGLTIGHQRVEVSQCHKRLEAVTGRQIVNTTDWKKCWMWRCSSDTDNHFKVVPMVAFIFNLHWSLRQEQHSSIYFFDIQCNNTTYKNKNNNFKCEARGLFNFLTSFTPTPRLTEHIPSKNAALLRR